MSPHNLFWEVEDIPTGAFPFALVDDYFSKLKPTAVVLYLFLLRQTEKTNQGVIRIHTKDILWVTGLDKKTLASARSQLADCKLVTSVETAKQGIWEYVVLNINTGGPLPSRENVEFAKLSNQVVMEFYQRLMPDRFDVESGRFNCPFSNHAKAAFHVTLDHGTSRHATWNCQRCRTYGGLIEFFVKLRGVSRQQATRRVRSQLQILMQEEQNALSRPVEFATTENSLIALV